MARGRRGGEGGGVGAWGRGSEAGMWAEGTACAADSDVLARAQASLSESTRFRAFASRWQGKSVVVDNTNPSARARAEYLELARRAGVPARCLHMAADRALAEHLNQARARPACSCATAHARTHAQASTCTRVRARAHARMHACTARDCLSRPSSQPPPAAAEPAAARRHGRRRSRGLAGPPACEGYVSGAAYYSSGGLCGMPAFTGNK